ncbi:hypothetical protein AO265_16595 [Pseudomonas sp. ABAC61]|nr:hypothetical protein AO265_16595 [Pseudomonas sp. ABAC61]
MLHATARTTTTRYSWVAAFGRLRERARTRKLLAQMNEQQLADSGISFCDRAAELHKPFWRD